ncbi:MAG TPA: prepilin-type N-terminal cleavage/methylation domain-containing protein, partial [Tepidisphaeraceae bacterium]|nr:prepilin-type N-terminal cleavage/methylation domain-containing protein [Tepidisphaeraceae bacterium]
AARHQAVRAFTLVEILVVVVILGIAASVVIPTLGARGDVRAQAACRALMADLMYAQNRAIASQKYAYVRFTVGSPTSYDKYELLDDTPTATTAIAHPVNVPNKYVAVLSDKRDAAIDAARSAAGALLDNCRLGTVAADGTTVGGVTVIGFDPLGVPQVYSAVGGTVPLAAPATLQVTSGQHSMTVTMSPYTGDLDVSTP